MSRFAQSRFAARFQPLVSRRRLEIGLYGEIAQHLPLDGVGRLLDVGTGTGLQLKAIHDMRAGWELFGLDLSPEAIRVALAHLEGLPVDLRVGSIEHTDYEDGFFDIVTCNASMSYWENTVACFDEIYRILRPGRSAILFEPQQDVDVDLVVDTFRANLAGASPLRRFAAVNLNRFALRCGR